MKIKDTYDLLNKELFYDLMGDLILDDDKISWTYDIYKNIDMIDNIGISEDEVEIISTEEKLQEAYYHDINLIKNNLIFFDDLGEWYFTEPILNHTTIISEFFLLD